MSLQLRLWDGTALGTKPLLQASFPACKMGMHHRPRVFQVVRDKQSPVHYTQ